MSGKFDREEISPGKVGQRIAEFIDEDLHRFVQRIPPTVGPGRLTETRVVGRHEVGCRVDRQLHGTGAGGPADDVAVGRGRVLPLPRHDGADGVCGVRSRGLFYPGKSVGA